MGRRVATVNIEHYVECGKSTTRYGERIEYNKKEQCTVMEIVEETSKYFKVKHHSFWLYTPFGGKGTRYLYLLKSDRAVLPTDRDFSFPKKDSVYCYWWDLKDLPPMENGENGENGEDDSHGNSFIEWIKSF